MQEISTPRHGQIQHDIYETIGPLSQTKTIIPINTNTKSVRGL